MVQWFSFILRFPELMIHFIPREEKFIQVDWRILSAFEKKKLWILATKVALIDRPKSFKRH